MKRAPCLTGLVLLGGLAAATAAAQDAAGEPGGTQQFSTAESAGNAYGPLLPRNKPVDVGGVQAVCTGVDLDSREDPRWSAFPLKLEFASTTGAYVAFAQVAVADAKGQNVLSVRCPGAWLLLGLPPGEYKTVVAVPAAGEQVVPFMVPRTGQKSVVVRFREANQGASAPAAPSAR
jgi:hypothetical protein